MSTPDFSDWDNVWVAPRHNGQDSWTVADYRKLTFSTEKEWQTAITIFEDRIRNRFLKIVDAIEDMPYAGFAVMALDSLLIETLMQFYHGDSETPRGQGRSYFVEYLTKSPFDFSEEEAERFYTDVRNGILHQAETRQNTRIRTDSNLPIVQLIQDGIVVNRRKFHQTLEKAFEQYVEKLRDPKNSELRDRFRRKMDAICHIPRSSEGV